MATDTITDYRTQLETLFHHGTLGSRTDSELLAQFLTGDAPSAETAFALGVPVVLNGLTMRAEQAGLFDHRFGAAVRAVVAIAIFFAFIGHAAQLLHRSDLERRKISDGLRITHGELQTRIGVQAAVEAKLRASEQNYRFPGRRCTADRLNGQCRRRGGLLQPSVV